jgi:hypothetical protein
MIALLEAATLVHNKVSGFVRSLQQQDSAKKENDESGVTLSCSTLDPTLLLLEHPNYRLDSVACIQTLFLQSLG